MRAAVQRVAIVVLRNLVGVAVDRKFAAVDAIAVASYDGAKVGLLIGLGRVAFNGVVAQHHVGHLAVAVAGFQRDDARAVVGDAHHEFGVLQRVNLRRPPVRQLAKVRFGDNHCGIHALHSRHHHQPHYQRRPSHRRPTPALLIACIMHRPSFRNAHYT